MSSFICDPSTCSDRQYGLHAGDGALSYGLSADICVAAPSEERKGERGRLMSPMLMNGVGPCSFSRCRGCCIRRMQSGVANRAMKRQPKYPSRYYPLIRPSVNGVPPLNMTAKNGTGNFWKTKLCMKRKHEYISWICAVDRLNNFQLRPK